MPRGVGVDGVAGCPAPRPVTGSMDGFAGWSGRANAEIAAELFMSVATVKAHVTRLFAKLAVENRVQIAMCVHDAGLV